MKKEELIAEGKRRRAALNTFADENDLDLKCYDEYDYALIGVAESAGSECPVVVYSTTLLIAGLQLIDGMTEEDAWEHFGYNIQNAYFGAGTPAFLMPGMDVLFVEEANGKNHSRH